MSIRRAFIGLPIALVLTSVMWFIPSASAQSPATAPADNVAVVKPGSSDPPNTVAVDGAKTGDLASEIEVMKAENAAFRDLLHKMAEQQKTLLEQVDRLQRRLDGVATADAAPSGLPLDSPPATDASAPRPTTPAKQKDDDDRYQDGIVLVHTSNDSKVPLLIKFNNNTQVRYLNTLDSNTTFTDHLGNVREVNKRNDITVNRSMFIFSGYIWNPKARYNLTVWTSAGASSIVVAGNIGWSFSKKLTITGGYTGVPGSRSLVNTFPYFTANDRSMADNFFRPGFTQGVWANGELGHGLNYLAFVGNGINTLSIAANKIDDNLLVAGSVWWEPLGRFSEPGKSVNMYDDYFAEKKVRIRVGTSFTRSREDRFSGVDQASPDNTAIYNSDGVLFFSTGALAAGVTVDKALYKMSAIDFGIKWNGLAINVQHFMRWLNEFEADGPLPLANTFDRGYELSGSYFVVPKKLMIYGRGSRVNGQFGNSWEFAGGSRWYFLPTERLWLNAELMRISRSPYSGTFTPYTAGQSGWAPMIQTIIAF